jgi:hypothetical protein
VNFLEERFPELQGRFTGDFYPQPPIAEFLLRVLQFVQFFAIVWMLGGGKKMLRMLPMYKQGRPLPKFYWIIHDNPVPILIFLFIVARPMLNQMQLKRSAFEIYLDDVLVFSLRSAGRIRPDALIEVFVQAGMTLVEPKK